MNKLVGRTFASLRFYNYRIWFFSALVANTGTWMQRVAQDWLVLAVLTHDNSFAVGVVTALQFLPLLFITPFAGTFADRFDKRKILYATQSTQALLAFGLGVLVLLGHATVAHVCIFALLLGTAAAFDAPPRQVFVSELVPSQSLPNAVGLNSTSFNIARLIGPGLSGILIAWVGAGWVFIINGVSFVATIIALALIKTDQLYPLADAASKRAKRGGVWEGFVYVRGRADILMIFLVTGTVSCLGLNFQLTTASMARTVFDKQAGEYGMLGSILAIGSVVGALLAARRRNQPRVRLVVGMTAVFGLAEGINALMPTYLTYALSLILCGLAMLILLTAANTAVQMSTEPLMRGRVMALYQTVMMGSAPLGAFLVGWISQTFSPRWGIGIGAIASLLVALGVFLWGRRHWHVEVHYHVRSRPHVEIIGPRERAEAEVQPTLRTPGDQPR